MQIIFENNDLLEQHFWEFQKIEKFSQFNKGSRQNKKCPKLWKKSKRGGQRQNQISLHFKCRLTLTEGRGMNFSDFFQIQITEIQSMNMRADSSRN